MESLLIRLSDHYRAQTSTRLEREKLEQQYRLRNQVKAMQPKKDQPNESRQIPPHCIPIVPEQFLFRRDVELHLVNGHIIDEDYIKTPDGKYDSKIIIAFDALEALSEGQQILRVSMDANTWGTENGEIRRYTKDLRSTLPTIATSDGGSFTATIESEIVAVHAIEVWNANPWWNKQWQLKQSLRGKRQRVPDDFFERLLERKDARKERDKFEPVALNTLRDLISEREYRRYVTKGFIVWHGKYGRYRLYKHGGVHITTLDGQQWRICIHTDNICPPTDHVINLLASLSIDEMFVWTEGNISRDKHAEDDETIPLPEPLCYLVGEPQTTGQGWRQHAAQMRAAHTPQTRVVNA